MPSDPTVPECAERLASAVRSAAGLHRLVGDVLDALDDYRDAVEGERGATPEQPITAPALARPDEPWAVAWWKFQEVVDERDRLAEALEDQRKGWDQALDEHTTEVRAKWRPVDRHGLRRRVPTKGKRLSDDHLRAVASTHADAAGVGRGPNAYVADVAGVSRATAGRWVKAATERGFMEQVEGQA